MTMNLNDPRIDDLMALIKDSFRVRPNQDPVYVDIGGNLPQFSRNNIKSSLGVADQASLACLSISIAKLPPRTRSRRSI